MHNSALRPLIRQGIRLDCIMDVGANIGATVQEFSQYFPQARIHAFEPVQETYDQLTKAVRELPNVTCNLKALGSREGTVRMAVAGTSPGNRIIAEHVQTKGDVVAVEQTTGDAYCSLNGLQHVDYLKIDAEGEDLQVAVGFSGMLSRQAVDFVQLECSLAPENRRHVPFDRIQALMFGFNYRLFGLFDLLPLKKSGLVHAYYGNVVFVRADKRRD